MYARAIFLALVLLGPVAAGSYQTSNLNLEADEDGRPDLEGRGQKNCVAEARAKTETEYCRLVGTPRKKNPAEGFRILDDYYATASGARWEDVLAADPNNPGEASFGLLTSSNFARATGGAVPDLILPGLGTFFAWLGFWNDLDGDGILTMSRLSSAVYYDDNEWNGATGGRLVSFIDPGSHPHYESQLRPDDTSPDIVYTSSDYDWRTPDSGTIPPIIFLDGSVLQTYTVTTVSNARLSPSEDGTKPYQTTDDSLTDIDEYHAASSGTLSELYAGTVADFVNSVGSPSLGMCPNSCGPGPVSAAGTPMAEAVHENESRIWRSYERETESGSRSVASGRAAEYAEAHLAYVDILARTGYVGPTNNPGGTSGYRPTGPIAGRGEEDGQAMLPGFLSFEAWTGLWRDINGDRFIGYAASHDPYEAGARPSPDDFTNPRGEFFGNWATEPVTTQPSGFLTIRLRPDPAWGVPGVLYLGGGNAPGVGHGGLICNSTETLCVRHPSTIHLTGEETIVLSVRKDPGTTGHYLSESVFLPEGTASFSIEACTGDWAISDSENLKQPIWDCDTIERLAMT